MRTIDPGLQAHLDGGATTICRCWQVVRQDDETFGFTVHDGLVEFGGMRFEAETGFGARALQTSSDLAVNNSEAIGAFSSDGIQSQDVETGLFDNASVRHWLVNWEMPDQNVLLFSGSLGEIRRTGQSFEAELRGLTERLNQPQGRAYIAGCDAILGDERCQVDLNDPAFRLATKVEHAAGRRVIFVRHDPQYDEGWFQHGKVLWQGGANDGSTSIILSDRLQGEERAIEFWQETAFAIAEEDEVVLFAGCDKRFSTCQQKFDNILKFRGFPHMPGEDDALSYPLRDGQNDGGSRGE